MKRRWIQKCDADDKNLPIPTQIVSNEEFAPPEQTVEQKQVEHRLIEIASEQLRRNLGISPPSISRYDRAEWRRLFWR